MPQRTSALLPPRRDGVALAQSAQSSAQCPHHMGLLGFLWHLKKGFRKGAGSGRREGASPCRREDDGQGGQQQHAVSFPCHPVLACWPHPSGEHHILI